MLWPYLLPGRAYIPGSKRDGDFSWTVTSHGHFFFKMGEAPAKGQLISKAIYGLVTSPKKRTDEFVLFAFLLFTANKSNSSIRFLGESTTCQSAFWFYLTLRYLVGRPVYIYWESVLFPGTITKWDYFSRYSDKHFFIILVTKPHDK